MPVITLQPDTLDDENARFIQVPLTQPVFLNSVPKSYVQSRKRAEIQCNWE